MNKLTFNYLATLGVILATDEKGNSQWQRIDDPEDFAMCYELPFLPALLSSDRGASDIIENISLIVEEDGNISDSMKALILSDVKTIEL